MIINKILIYFCYQLDKINSKTPTRLTGYFNTNVKQFYSYIKPEGSEFRTLNVKRIDLRKESFDWDSEGLV